MLQKRREKEAENAAVEALKAEKKLQQAGKRKEKDTDTADRSRKRTQEAVQQVTDCEQKGKKHRTQKRVVAP